jgi:hypothetical protein
MMHTITKEDDVMRSIKVTISIFFISLIILSVDFGFTLDQPLSGAVEEPVGKVDFQISCSPDAQSRFNRSLALLHHMMYRQAEKEFTAIAGLDPDCAMAYWGVAMTLFHSLWAPPNEDELRRGLEAVNKAESLKPATKTVPIQSALPPGRRPRKECIKIIPRTSTPGPFMRSRI